MQTLISAFDDRDAARRAVERLVKAGFEREDIHLQEAPGRGRSVVCVDAKDDAQAEYAATLLHQLGAVDVNEFERSGQPPLRDVVAARRAQMATSEAETTR